MGATLTPIERADVAARRAKVAAAIERRRAARDAAERATHPAIHLPGDKVRVLPGSFPALAGLVGWVLDVLPGDLFGYDFKVQFPGGAVLLYARELVPA